VFELYAQIEVERLRLQDIWFASSNQAQTQNAFSKRCEDNFMKAATNEGLTTVELYFMRP
jgi:hypothetical protein